MSSNFGMHLFGIWDSTYKEKIELMTFHEGTTQNWTIMNYTQSTTQIHSHQQTLSFPLPTHTLTHTHTHTHTHTQTHTHRSPLTPSLMTLKVFCKKKETTSFPVGDSTQHHTVPAPAAVETWRRCSCDHGLQGLLGLYADVEAKSASVRLCLYVTISVVLC
jgi:hypothetical protein